MNSDGICHVLAEMCVSALRTAAQTLTADDLIEAVSQHLETTDHHATSENVACFLHAALREIDSFLGNEQKP